ncbi:unnamed protein product [Cladocopium goreaui]|uniref:Uncharacterized protein n=1 Tax=Cladocopium goreaui TaxID=2562237 RepID=A0A9P1FF17_9DINO|nr:unnamed protein product [Cladocopium goreaui]
MVRHEPLVSLDSWRGVLRCQHHLQDDRVTDLELYRKDYQSCETVDLAENKFTHVALRYILPYCLQFSGLEVLKLYKNDIGDAGADLLADFCERSPALRELHLSHNRIKAHGAVVIIHAAERSRKAACTPLWLRLERNAVEHASDIADALQQRLSVCLRCDRRVCNRGFCIHHCKVHLPFFLLQFDMPGGALNEVHTKQEPDSWLEQIPKRPRLEKSDTPETGISESESSDWIPPPPPLPGTSSPDLDSTKVRLFNRHIGHLSLGQGIQDALLPQQLQPLPPPALRPPRPTSAAGAAFAANTVRNVLSNPGRRSNRKQPEEKAEFPPKPAPAAPEAESPRVKPSCAVPGHRTAGPDPEASPKLAVNLVSRQVVQSRKTGAHEQASVAMKAKVDELKAWQHYLEARERFMSLCEEIPTPCSDEEETKEGEGREVHWQST